MCIRDRYYIVCLNIVIILIGRTLPHQNIFFMKPGKGNIETKVYSSASINNFIHCKKHILFLHAITGCDTTSAIFGKGKNRVMKLFEKRPDLHQAAQVFQQENCPPETIYNNGILFLLAIYGAPKTKKSIDNYRYLQSGKSTRLNDLLNCPLFLLLLQPLNDIFSASITRYKLG